MLSQSGGVHSFGRGMLSQSGGVHSFGRLNNNLAVFALHLGLSLSLGFKIKFGTHIKVGTLHGHNSLVLCLVFASLTRFFIIMYDRHNRVLARGSRHLGALALFLACFISSSRAQGRVVHRPSPLARLLLPVFSAPERRCEVS
jgi:hypothetical protein